MSNIAIIIPAYKENENIFRLIKKIKSIIPESYIYIVDDSPKKNLIKKKLKNNINFFYRNKKLGRGSAVIYGLKKAILKKNINIFIEMDADFSHNPTELKKKINFFKKNKLDLLIASRYISKSRIINWPYSRKILSFLANFIAKQLLRVPVTDYTNGFRIYSKKSAQVIINECGKIGDGFIILSEILFKIYSHNLKISELPTIFVNRKRGESSLNFSLILFSFFGLIKLIFIKFFK
jgi:dolichol-phosphate mannosyltransferase